MRAIETMARVSPRGELMARVPRGVSPGEHSVILILTDFQQGNKERRSIRFPVDHVGRWPERLSLSREDLYGDNGR